MPSIIVFTIVFIVRALQLVRKGENIFDAELLSSVETHLRIDYEKYQGHVNWITWILISLCFIK